jgi:hypothetical protein
VTFTYLVISHNYLEIILCREIHSKAVIFSLLQELTIDLGNIEIKHICIFSLKKITHIVLLKIFNELELILLNNKGKI